MQMQANGRKRHHITQVYRSVNNLPEQEPLNITTADIQIVSSMKIWTTPLLHTYWQKTLTSVYQLLAAQMNQLTPNQKKMRHYGQRRKRGRDLLWQTMRTQDLIIFILIFFAVRPANVLKKT